MDYEEHQESPQPIPRSQTGGTTNLSRAPIRETDEDRGHNAAGLTYEQRRWIQEAITERGPASHNDSGLFNSATSQDTGRGAAETTIEALRAEIQQLRTAQPRQPTVNYVKLFTEIAEKNPVKFYGTPPAQFKYNDEPFKEFRKRFSAYAMSAGWNGPKQMTAMLRCLPERPTSIFMGWIEQGLLKDMDVSKMWELMEAKFSDPDRDRQKAKLELAQRPQQQGESVAAYEEVFMKLAERAELTEAEKIDWWKDSIDATLSDVVHTLGSGQTAMTIEEAARIARKAERPQKEARPLQLALRRTIHAVKEVRPEEADQRMSNIEIGQNHPGETPSTTTMQIRAVEMAKELVAVDVRRQMAKREVELDSELRGMKRKMEDIGAQQSHTNRAPIREMEDDIRVLRRKVDELQVRNIQQPQPARGPPPSRGPPTQRGPPSRFANPQSRVAYLPREANIGPVPTQNAAQQPEQGTVARGRKPVDCFKCGETGHYRSECRWSGTCSICGKEGHSDKVCLTRNRREGPAQPK